MRTIISFIFLIVSMTLSAQESFDKYFTDKVLRFDFMLAGNSQKTSVYPVGIKEEPFWAGSKTNLINPFNSGNFKYELYDVPGNTLIYSRPFCTLFQEWQTTAEAKATDRSFYEVATMPYPKDKVRFILSKRERNGLFSKLYETIIDPASYFIRKESPLNVGITKIYSSGDPHTSVDLADEYYSSSVAYDEFYPLSVEPWEPNITTLVNFESKWKKMINKDTPQPTPSEEKFKNVTGLFEGGGYSPKGIYRSEMDCRMKSNGTKGYCSVCRNAIKEMIEFYIK